MSEIKQDLSSQLREATTVLDEPFHREAIAVLLEKAAYTLADRERECVEQVRLADEAWKLLQDERLSHQETRGAVAAWKQEYATIVRIVGDAECGSPEDCDGRRPKSMCLRCQLKTRFEGPQETQP